jgi:hypothetical protein
MFVVLSTIAACEAKIRQAQRQLDQIQTLVEPLNHAPYGVMVEVDEMTGAETGRARIPNDFPIVDVAVITGGVIHQLRSCLEHLAWGLVVTNGQPPKEGATGFPVFTEDWHTKKESRYKWKRLTRGIAPPAVNLIDRMQPYHEEQPEDHVLWALNEMWNRDKHRALDVAVVATGGTVDILAKPGGHFGMHELSNLKIGGGIPVLDGDELYRIHISDLTPDIQVVRSLTLTLAFSREGPGKGRPLLDSLSQFTQDIPLRLDAFRPFLPPS